MDQTEASRTVRTPRLTRQRTGHTQHGARLVVLLLSSAWFATGTLGAAAQSDATKTDPPPASRVRNHVKAPKQENSATPTGLEDIVVTAQKRSENLASVPGSVTAISSKRLEALHATSLEDYAAYIPGLQVDSFGTAGQTQITLRGIAPIGSSSEVGTYIDDAPLGSSSLYDFGSMFQLDLLPYDLKDVEVLRGPQGTLYGASTMGGLLKYSLQSPDTNTFHAAIGSDVLGVENGGGVGGGLRGMVNYPLLTDKLGLRASFFYEDTPGYIDDRASHQNANNDTVQEGGRLALLWTPSSDLKVQLDGFFQRISAANDAVVALSPTGGPLLGDLTNNLPLSQAFTQDVALMKANVTYTLPFATLTSVSSYSVQRNLQLQDLTPVFKTFFSALTGQPGVAPQKDLSQLHKVTEEVRLASLAGTRLEWLVGTFFTREDVSNKQFNGAYGPGYVPLDAINPAVGAALNPLLVATLPSHYQEEAVFGDATLHIVGGWSIGGGLRFSHNDQDSTQIARGFLVGTPFNISSSAAENVLTYSANTKYQFNRDTEIYARVASGFQPGGPNIALPGIPPTVAPSTLTSYEIGYKSRLFDRRLSLDLSAFHIDWDQIQTNALNPQGLTYLANGGTAVSQGGEASAQFRALDDLTFGGTFSYTDSYFSKPVPGLGLTGGERLPFVPLFNTSFNADYQHDLFDGWHGDLNGGLRFEGSRSNYYFGTPSRPALAIHENAFAALDLNARMTRGGWSIGLFVKNLTDRRAYLTEVPLPNALAPPLLSQIGATVLQPRTIGLTIDRRF